jgi:type I restriction enzyme S subunit
VTKLGSVLTDLVDCEHKTAPQDDEGEFFSVGTPAMAGNVIDYSQARRISEETYKNWSRRLTPKAGDLLLAREAPVGRVVEIPAAENVAPGQRTVLMRPDADAVYPKYLFYALTAPDTQAKLQVKAAGSTVAHLNVADIRAFEFAWTFPNVATQRAIAELLGALDDKMAANSRLVGATKAFLAGRLAAAADKGANMVALGDVARFHNSRRVPLSSRQRNDRRGEVPYWGANGVLDHVDEALFNEPLVLVGEDGSVQDEGGRPIVHYVWGPTWVNNHAHVLTGVGISTELLRYAVEAGNVAHLVTGAVQPKLSMGNLKRLELRVPTDLQPIEVLCADLQRRLVAASIESDQLANLRDTLLPHLMSGRITVREAEQAVEEVL